MSDTDKELDAMLTETEDTATVEDPQADVVDSDDSDANADASAGRQPNAKQDDTPDEQDGDAQDTKAKDTVPLRTYIDMRRTLREQARMQREELREELRELRAELSELRQQNKPVDQDDVADEEEDEDAPLTRADLRRIEAKRSQETAEQTRQQQLQKVEQALQVADETQRRLLMLAEPYLTRADRKRIVDSDDILATAVDVAKSRIEMFGSDEEVDWLGGLTPPESKSQKKSASQSRPKTNDRSRREPETVESDSEQADDLDVSPNVRGVLDHMFG